MPKSDWCRKNMDRVKEECYGGELSVDTMRDSRLAIEFCKRAPCLTMQSTLAVNKIRTIKDPKIQGKVIEMVESALKKGEDPRTNEKFSRKSGAFAITMPLIKWMIQYAETCVRPPYTKRGQPPEPQITSTFDTTPILVAFDELLSLKFDRRAGGYFIPHSNMAQIKELRAKISQARAAAQ